MSLSDTREVNLFWAAYENALLVDRRMIETNVVRSAVEAIGALEAEKRELAAQLEAAENYANSLADKISWYNPQWMMEE